MKDLLSVLGMGDGEGNTSSTRVILVATALAWIASKFYNAYLGHGPITWDTSDVEMIGALGGLGALKTVAEKSPSK